VGIWQTTKFIPAEQHCLLRAEEQNKAPQLSRNQGSLQKHASDQEK